jgi:hypothetical protein
MKKAALILTALAFFLPSILSAQEEGYYAYSYARLSYVNGDVVVERAGDLGTEQGVVNLALVEGDKLGTKAGRAEIQFGKKNYLRLDENTNVEFANLPRQGDDLIRMHLLSGSIYLRVKYLEAEKSIEMHTPDASFYVLEAGLYRLDAQGNGQSELAVIEGSVEAAGEQGSELIGSQTRLLANSGRLGSQLSLSYDRDDFDYWNDDRDSLGNQYVSKRYLSSELEDYESELASNGNWVYERPYGYVWVPTVYYSDWRPYYYGRWLWYAGCGWNWVSDEPWGWATYHYGRWHWRMGMGWYWIPTYHWGPAWVHWYNGYDYVGWCPLSWYDRPVVIINNYFYDRYNHSRYPAESRALTVVHRNQLQSREVSSAALKHVDASRLGQITLQGRQPDVKPIISRSGLEKGSSSRGLTPPSMRPSDKSLSSPGTESVPRTLDRSSLAKDRAAPSEIPSNSNSRFSPRSQTESRGLRAYPSQKSEQNSVRSSPGIASPSTRNIKPYSRASETPSGSSFRSGIKSYSPSRGISPSEPKPSIERKESPRIYSPNAGITRFGSSELNSSRISPRQAPSFGQSRTNEWRSKSYSSPSTPRGEAYSGGSSFSAPSRSIFSPPRMSSAPSKSSGFSAPSFSRSASGHSSAPSSSSAPRSVSTPRSSSPSQGSSGGAVKKHN